MGDYGQNKLGDTYFKKCNYYFQSNDSEGVLQQFHGNPTDV